MVEELTRILFLFLAVLFNLNELTQTNGNTSFLPNVPNIAVFSAYLLSVLVKHIPTKRAGE